MMPLSPPTANVLNRLLWLGKTGSNEQLPGGSGVVIYHDKNQYMVTALHVAKSCGFQPLVRFNGQWNSMDWRTAAISQDHDVAVLETDAILDDKRIPVLYGEPEGLMFGQIGYALGFPGFQNDSVPSVAHILEVRGERPMPMPSLVTANFAAGARSTYSASYINAGFSGGAIVFPMRENNWTIAGIITHFPTIRRPVYRDGKKTQDFVAEHTGLVGYTGLGFIQELIEDPSVENR